MRPGVICPSCGGAVDQWTVFSSETAGRIRCPSCGTRLRYTDARRATIIGAVALIVPALLAILLAWQLSKAPAPLMLFGVGAVLGVWPISNLLSTRYLTRHSTLEIVYRDGQKESISKRRRRAATVTTYVLLFLAPLVLSLSILWVYLYVTDWSGHFTEKLQPGQVVEIEPGGASVEVPEGWAGASGSQIGFPWWLGLEHELNNGHLAYYAVTLTEESDEGDFYVCREPGIPDWSDVERTVPEDGNLETNETLESLGVQWIRLLEDRDTPSGMHDYALFADRPQGRMYISVRVAAGEREPTADDIVAALEEHGLHMP